MNVQSATAVAHPLTSDTILNSAKRHSKFDRAAQKDSQPDAAPSKGAGATDVIGSLDGGEKRGVLRLLEEGHFRGVADVRLRINFFEELSARADHDAADAAREQAPDLIDGINGQVDSVADSLALDDDARSALDESQAALASVIHGAVEEFGSSADRDALERSLRIAFESILGTLRDFLPPEPVEPGEGIGYESIGTLRDYLPPEPVEPRDGIAYESIGPLREFIPPETVAPREGRAVFQELIGVFEEALATFLASIGSTARLPDPAPANGNGRAYAKFLAAYNELRGDDPAVDEVG